MTDDRDFLDEIVRERADRNSAFAGLVQAAYERRLAARLEPPQDMRVRRGPHPTAVDERGGT